MSGYTPNEQLDIITRSVGGRSAVLEQWRGDVPGLLASPVVVARFMALAREMQELLVEHGVDIPGSKRLVESPLGEADWRWVVLEGVKTLSEMHGRMEAAVEDVKAAGASDTNAPVEAARFLAKRIALGYPNADPNDFLPRGQARGRGNRKVETPPQIHDLDPVEHIPVSVNVPASGFSIKGRTYGPPQESNIKGMVKQTTTTKVSIPVGAVHDGDGVFSLKRERFVQASGQVEEFLRRRRELEAEIGMTVSEFKALSPEALAQWAEFPAGTTVEHGIKGENYFATLSTPEGGAFRCEDRMSTFEVEKMAEGRINGVPVRKLLGWLLNDFPSLMAHEPLGEEPSNG